MAKKPTPKTDPIELIIISVMNLAARHGWRHVSMQDIADETGLSLPELRQHIPVKNDFLKLFVTFVDQQVLDEVGTLESQEPPRERLFDVLMTRFEKLSPYRDGIAALMRDGLVDPIALAKQFCILRQSMAAMLAAAEIPTSGPFGALRLKGALILYASVFRIWLKDESTDLSKTMAALDKALTQLDKWARRIPA